MLVLYTYLNDVKTGKYQPKSLNWLSNWLETKVYSNNLYCILIVWRSLFFGKLFFVEEKCKD